MFNEEILNALMDQITTVPQETNMTYADAIMSIFSNTSYTDDAVWSSVSQVFSQLSIKPSGLYSKDGALNIRLVAKSILNRKAQRQDIAKSFNSEADQHARQQFKFVGQILQTITREDFAIATVNDPANLFSFNLLCNNDWQVLTPREQKQIMQAKDTDEISNLINNLAKRVEQIEN